MALLMVVMVTSVKEAATRGALLDDDFFPRGTAGGVVCSAAEKTHVEGKLFLF
jgi:hypothetical protein